jgi:hypothetical protein
LHRGERRPLREKVDGLHRRQVADPFQRLWKVLLQQAGQPVRQRHALIHQFPALFTQRLQCSALDRVGYPRAQLVAVAHHQVQQQRGIERASFAPLVLNASR